MQRWIVAAVVLVVLTVLAAGSAAVAHRAYKRNLATRVWLPMPINPEMSSDRRSEVVKMLSQKLGDRVLLAQISKEVGLVRKMNYPSNEAAALDLSKRLFVEIGQADTPQGKVPSLNIGLQCKVKEYFIMGEVVNRMRTDVCKILGLPEPKKDLTKPEF